METRNQRSRLFTPVRGEVLLTLVCPITFRRPYDICRLVHHREWSRSLERTGKTSRDLRGTRQQTLLAFRLAKDWYPCRKEEVDGTPEVNESYEVKGL